MKEHVKQSISKIKIESVYESLSDSEKRIADYFLNHLDEIIHLSVTETAQATKTSEATVVRTCKKLGYGGFYDFKITAAQEISNPVKTIFEEAEETDDSFTIFQKKVGNAISTLQYTSQVLDKDQLEAAVSAILSANKIIVLGSGNSASVALDAAHKFMRAGLNSLAYSDSHMQIIASANAGEGDVVLGISHSGSSKDVVDAMRVAKKGKATTIAITNYSRSPITEISDIILYTASEETKYHVVALSSRLAQLTIIDTLYIIISLKNQNISYKRMSAIEKALQTKKY